MPSSVGAPHSSAGTELTGMSTLGPQSGKPMLPCPMPLSSPACSLSVSHCVDCSERASHSVGTSDTSSAGSTCVAAVSTCSDGGTTSAGLFSEPTGGGAWLAEDVPPTLGRIGLLASKCSGRAAARTVLRGLVLQKESTEEVVGCSSKVRATLRMLMFTGAPCNAFLSNPIAAGINSSMIFLSASIKSSAAVGEYNSLHLMATGTRCCLEMRVPSTCRQVTTMLLAGRGPQLRSSPRTFTSTIPSRCRMTSGMRE
mmetsp:Transcript_38292/g.92045  ORF Transcript_38292/g.92045 Transcript_38292/m.92045 type:complete len:255 (+) Transcript_38292:1884-2648(+)